MKSMSSLRLLQLHDVIAAKLYHLPEPVYLTPYYYTA
jgi:hypothetical protein